MSVRTARVRLVDTRCFPPGPASSIVEAHPPGARSAGSGGETSVGYPQGVPCVRATYRPLVIGAAVLYRPDPAVAGADDRRWRVDLVPGKRLRPDAPPSVCYLERLVRWRRQSGCQARIGAALVSCCDVAAGAATRPDEEDQIRFVDPASRGRGAAIEIYGWSLLVAFPPSAPFGLVDPHDDHDDLPAWYESPLELVDRISFLAARGIPSRPIALITRPEDFHPEDAPGSPLRNRIFPNASFRRPADLRRLF